ncbi:MAG: ATP-dependent Clp protease ATP-binding subunit [Candidatus Nealsonbacteria bacterium]
MDNFNFKTSTIYNSLKLGNFFVFKWIKALKIILFVPFATIFFIFLFGFFSDTVSINSLSFFLGLSLIFFSLYLGLLTKEWFLNIKLKNPRLVAPLKEVAENPNNFNLAEFLSYSSAEAIDKSIKFSNRKKLPFINSSILFYQILDNKDFNFVFLRILINLKDLKKTLKINTLKDSSRDKLKAEYSVDFEETILEALQSAKRKDHSRIEIGDLLVGLAKSDPIFKNILLERNLKVLDIENLTWWLWSLRERIAERKKFWKWKNLIKKGSLAKAWSSGYTITLDRFGIDLSEVIAKTGFTETIGHQKAIESTERILARREMNNCLIIGEPGVGKKSMLLELARRSVLGESLVGVNYKRIIQLDLPSIAAQTATTAEVEEILDVIFQETAAAGNIILIIEGFHNFVGGEDRPGVMDISGVLAPYLKFPQFQIIAVTTFSGLHRQIEQKPGILSEFEKVELSELSNKETLMILEKMTLSLEHRYKVFITFPALKQIISLADKYFSIPFPKSAMDLLDEVLVYAISLKEKIVLVKHVNAVVSGKTKVPVGDVEEKERGTLLNLEDLLHQRIINQVEGVREIATALRRARSQITVRKGPMGTFLFLGPTGVGKTETSKALAEIYFGSEDRMIRLDMSEYQNVNDIPRLLGSPGEEGMLTTKIRENPFSLLLLDEIEKAHPNILNLFLQVLDEGFLTDGLGRKVDFKNCIIIATSNAGYRIILKALKEKTEWVKVKREILDYLFEEGLFRPEFINRFDSMVLFQPLSQNNLLGIAELMLGKLKNNLKEQGIELIITESLKEKIAELGYNPTFGARQMRRVIQDKVENVLAFALLSKEIKRGDKVEINSNDFSLKIH